MTQGYQCNKCKQFFAGPKEHSPPSNMGTATTTMSGYHFVISNVIAPKMADILPVIEIDLCNDCRDKLNKWMDEP